jgi:hypothetical protein
MSADGDIDDRPATRAGESNFQRVPRPDALACAAVATGVAFDADARDAALRPINR